MKNNTTNGDYVTLKIPRALADEIDQIIESGTLGYRSRAELVADAVRRRVEELNHNNSKGNNTFKQNDKQ